MVPSSAASASSSTSATMASGVSMSSMLSSVLAGGRVLTRVVGHEADQLVLVLDRVESLELVHGGFGLHVHHVLSSLVAFVPWCDALVARRSSDKDSVRAGPAPAHLP